MGNENNIPVTALPFNDTGNAVVLNSEDLVSKTQSDADKNSIVAIMKHSGEITGYELSSGEQITKERGVELAKAGNILGVSVSTSRNGEEYLRSLRDDDESNNLSSLPIIEE